MQKKTVIILIAVLALIGAACLFFYWGMVEVKMERFMIENRCCEKKNSLIINNLFDKGMRWEDGISFLDGGIVIINPWEAGKLIISEDIIGATKEKIIIGSTLLFYQCSVVAINAPKNDPYSLSGEEKEYCLKTDGEKLYIKAPKEKEWSELKFKYLGEIPKDKHTYETEIAYYPCKKIKLECKYFSGIYEIHCER